MEPAGLDGPETCLTAGLIYVTVSRELPTLSRVLAPKFPEAPELTNKELSGKEVALHATSSTI
ncbi:hypothetical protein DV515_00012572 [Chloebia gouldiae]|uniref:Uncharacterized protein n=1 Tax=Chloebia gouldiae TaxID=44316 RepID=A0A3L8S4N7_CHLGU|nr:hypothetical protein DV515_00012572 [Chloebia gouldiae]